MVLLLFAFALFVQVIQSHQFPPSFPLPTKKASQNPKPLFYDMSTLAETLADPSRPSFLFGGSISRAVSPRSLRVSLRVVLCAFSFWSARASTLLLDIDRKSNPIGAHKTGARGQKARAIEDSKNARAQTQRAVLGLPSLARFTRAPKGG